MAEKSESEIEVMTKLSDMRKRVMEGQDISDEELKQSIALLQSFRDKTAKPIKEKKEKAVKTKAASRTTQAEARNLLSDLLKG